MTTSFSRKNAWSSIIDGSLNNLVLTLKKSLSLRMFGPEEEIWDLLANILSAVLKSAIWCSCSIDTITMVPLKIYLWRLLMLVLGSREFLGWSTEPQQVISRLLVNLTNFWIQSYKFPCRMRFGILLVLTAASWTLMRVRILMQLGSRLVRSFHFLWLILKEQLSPFGISSSFSTIPEQLLWLSLMVGFPATQVEVQIAETLSGEYSQL